MDVTEKWGDDVDSNVVLSLDGSRDTNDRMRKTKQGKGTYDLIVDKFIDFAKRT